jgi:hypothetical protein
MGSCSDEVSFLEQQIQLLNRGALADALQLTTTRLHKLKSNMHSRAFDPKVLLIYVHLSYSLSRTDVITTVAEHPSGLRRTQRLAVQGACGWMEP